FLPPFTSYYNDFFAFVKGVCQVLRLVHLLLTDFVGFWRGGFFSVSGSVRKKHMKTGLPA
ncbi:MAG: hypothetical protein LBR73_03030, partial [Oscillospiraceae bacterium]|nr:hypothetical protein [Oscillospiraceae bacterium]